MKVKNEEIELAGFFLSEMELDFPMKTFADFESAKDWVIQLKNEREN